MKLKSQEISNPSRFWTGVVMGSVEVIALVVLGLSLLDWSWYNLKISIAILIISAIIGYNLFAGLLIWTGSRTKKKPTDN